MRQGENTPRDGVAKLLRRVGYSVVADFYASDGRRFSDLVSSEPPKVSKAVQVTGNGGLMLSKPVGFQSGIDLDNRFVVVNQMFSHPGISLDGVLTMHQKVGKTLNVVKRVSGDADAILLTQILLSLMRKRKFHDDLHVSSFIAQWLSHIQFFCQNNQYGFDVVFIRNTVVDYTVVTAKHVQRHTGAFYMKANEGSSNYAYASDPDGLFCAITQDGVSLVSRDSLVNQHIHLCNSMGTFVMTNFTSVLLISILALITPIFASKRDMIFFLLLAALILAYLWH